MVRPEICISIVCLKSVTYNKQQLITPSKMGLTKAVPKGDLGQAKGGDWEGREKEEKGEIV